MQIRPYRHPSDLQPVIDLWIICDLTRPWNNPEKDILRKLKTDPELFLIGEVGGKIVATAMGGYEGHRGWVNYLGVDPQYQRQGLAREIMKEIERLLKERGCPKINLQIRNNNLNAIEFYRRIGYNVEEITSMGKRLEED